MELTLNRISPENQKNPPASMEGVVFGTVFSNHMFSMVWDDGMGWHDERLVSSDNPIEKGKQTLEVQ